MDHNAFVCVQHFLEPTMAEVHGKHYTDHLYEFLSKV